jgi:hypothetical protein
MRGEQIKALDKNTTQKNKKTSTSSSVVGRQKEQNDSKSYSD